MNALFPYKEQHRSELEAGDECACPGITGLRVIRYRS